MNFKDWSAVYNNLFICLKFPDAWSGYRFQGAWTEANSGGTPLKNTPENNALWATNPQYLVELKECEGVTHHDVFISLAQPDQRVIPGQVYPFPALKKTMISVWKLDEDEVHLDAFDRSKKPMMTTIKEYKEQSLSLQLEPGRYMIVPSCKSPGKYSKFFLNIYFSCG